TETPQRYTLAVNGLAGIALVKSVDVTITPAEARWVAVAVRIPPQTAAQAGSGAHAIEFELQGAAGTAARASVKEKSTFVVLG
ncbi:FixG Ig-like domain-containing protein, partial [Roseateles sp. GG27B]